MIPGSIPGGRTFALQFDPVFFFFLCKSCLASAYILSTLCLIQTRVRAPMLHLVNEHYSKKIQGESLRVISTLSLLHRVLQEIPIYFDFPSPHHCSLMSFFQKPVAQ